MKAFLYVFLASWFSIATIQPALAAKPAQLCAAVLQSEPTGNRRFQLPIVSMLDADKFESPVKISPEMKKIREQYLSTLKNDALRETVAATMEVELRLASGATKRRIETMQRAVREMKYDVIVIGAGIHGVISAATLMRANKDLRVLVVDNSDTAASNFRLARDMFRINSSNRASSQSMLPVPGEGNINELPSLPIQVSDLTAEKYPSANDLAVPLLTGLYGLMKSYPKNVDVLFNTKVVSNRMSPSGDVTGLNLLFEGAAKSITVGSQVVMATTGLGIPKIPFEVIRRETTPEEKVRLARLEKIPQIITFEDAFRILSQNSNPIEFFSKKKVGIVGKGDSANVFIEFLLGYAPKKAYGISDAQEKTPDRIYWFGQDANTCEAFIKTARSRYAQIGTGFRSSSKDRRPILQSAGKVKRATELRRGREVQVDLVDGTKQDVDYLIVATGYEQQVRMLFSSREANDMTFFDKSFDYIKGETTISDGDDVRIGRYYKGGSNGGKNLSFVITGPAAGELPKKEELLGIIQNYVSIFNNAPRVEALAKKIARRLKPTSVSDVVPETVLLDDLGGRQLYAIRDLQEFRLLQTQPENYVRAAVTTFFKYLQFKRPGTIEIDMVYNPEMDVVTVRSDTGFDVSYFTYFLTQSRDLPNFIRAVSRNSREIDGIKVKAQVTSVDGKYVIQANSIVLSTLGKEAIASTSEIKRLSKDRVFENHQLPLQK